MGKQYGADAHDAACTGLRTNVESSVTDPVPQYTSKEAGMSSYQLGYKDYIPISKLYGVPRKARNALKRRSINTCRQLLILAAWVEDREVLARATGIPQQMLTILVQRADMARIHGIGVVVTQMLAELGIVDVATLATQDPMGLRNRIASYNKTERIVMRIPTLAEIVGWVDQARSMPNIVSYLAAESCQEVAYDLISCESRPR